MHFSRINRSMCIAFINQYLLGTPLRLVLPYRRLGGDGGHPHNPWPKPATAPTTQTDLTADNADKR